MYDVVFCRPRGGCRLTTSDCCARAGPRHKKRDAFRAPLDHLALDNVRDFQRPAWPPPPPPPWKPPPPPPWEPPPPWKLPPPAPPPRIPPCAIAGPEWKAPRGAPAPL